MKRTGLIKKVGFGIEIGFLFSRINFFSHGKLLLLKWVNHSSYLLTHQILCNLCLKQTVFKAQNSTSSSYVR